MRSALLLEPELEFGGGLRQVGIRFGIMGYGPFDVALDHSPKRIRTGIVGTEKTLEKFSVWLDQCRAGIAAKDGNTPNLFPRFPGLGEDVALRCSVVTDKALQRAVHFNTIRSIIQKSDHNEAVKHAVNLFHRELEYLSKSKTASPDVLVCAPPVELFRFFDRGTDEEEEGDAPEKAEPGQLDFHDVLKAKSLSLPVPSPTMPVRRKFGRKARNVACKTRRRGRGISSRRFTTKRAERRGVWRVIRATSLRVSSESVSIAPWTENLSRPALPKYSTSAAKESFSPAGQPNTRRTEVVRFSVF
jgi:hypothetical protein